MAIPTIVTGIVQFGLILLLFRKSLKTKIQVEETKVKITSKIDMLFGLIHLIICLLLLIISSYISLDMWLICILCAASLLIFIISIHLIRGKNLKIIKHTAKRLPFNLVPFIISMFVIVLALKKHGVTDIIFNFFGNENVILKYGATSFVASNLINNIPMSVLYSNIIQFSDPSLQNKAIYSTIIGSNLGAFLTPVGALAGIMFTDLVEKQGLKFSFKSFVLYGSIISIPTLVVALTMLYLII
jgi:arsenical pump membrane protein